MAGAAAGQPAQRLDFRTISILRRTAPLMKRRGLEMLDRNRIREPPIALRPVGEDDELDACRRVRHRRENGAVGFAVPVRLRAIRNDAQSGHERTASRRSAAFTTASGGIRVRQRKSPGAQTRWSHGRQGSSPASTASLRRSPLRHGCDRTGSVGPYSATIGTFDAAAMCSGPAVAADVERRGIDERPKLGQRKLAAAEHALRGLIRQPAARVRDDSIDGIGFRWSGGDHDSAVLGRQGRSSRLPRRRSRQAIAGKANSSSRG